MALQVKSGCYACTSKCCLITFDPEFERHQNRRISSGAFRPMFQVIQQNDDDWTYPYVFDPDVDIVPKV